MKQTWRTQAGDFPTESRTGGAGGESRKGATAKRRAWPARVLAAVLAVAGVLLCGLAPLWAFRAQDEALFSAPRPYDAPVGQLPLVPEDITLVRRMYERERANLNGEYIETKIYDSGSTEAVARLLPRTQGYLNQLVEAGVLPKEVRDYLEAEIFFRPELNYSHYLDTKGRETLNCNFGMGEAPPYYFGLTVDMATDLVVHMELYLPNDAPVPAITGSARRLESYLAYLGLDVARDWKDDSDIYGGVYEENTEAVSRRSAQLRVMAGYTQRIDEWQRTFFCWVDSYVTMDEAPAGDADTASSQVGEVG